MTFGDVLIVLLILVAVTQITLFIRKRWGRLEGVTVELGHGPLRTRGEVNRELWAQKNDLDRAVNASALATTTYTPDAPCECEVQP